MILVSIFVFVFLWGYLKLFPRGNRWKMILAVTVFSLLVSFVVSFLSVSSRFGVYGSDVRALVYNNRSFMQLSMPFHLERWELFYLEGGLGIVGFAIYFADVKLWDMVFGTCFTGEVRYIHPRGQLSVDYTTTLFFQFILIFTAFNIIGAPLATFTYKLTDTFAKKVIPRISRFHKRAQSNRLYRWLFPY